MLSSSNFSRANELRFLSRLPRQNPALTSRCGGPPHKSRALVRAAERRPLIVRSLGGRIHLQSASTPPVEACTGPWPEPAPSSPSVAATSAKDRGLSLANLTILPCARTCTCLHVARPWCFQDSSRKKFCARMPRNRRFQPGQTLCSPKCPLAPGHILFHRKQCRTGSNSREIGFSGTCLGAGRSSTTTFPTWSRQYKAGLRLLPEISQ